MDNTSRFDRVISTVLTLATVVAAGVLVKDRLFPAPASKNTQRVVYVDDWREQLESLGVPLDGAKPVTVAVFSDFQCPFCKRMDSTMARIVSKNPQQVGRTVIHFPIPTHPFAEAAAQAFECAVAQGRARQMHQALYELQSSLGAAEWSVYGKAAEVPNLEMFEACVTDGTRSTRIGSGFSFGRTLGISGTPAVIINGWLFDPAFPDLMEGAIVDAAAGKKPK